MIAIIHGSTCGATYSFIKPRKNGGFGAFERLFGQNVSLFWWASSLEELSFWQCFNPRKLIKIYQTDKNYVQTEIAQTKILEFLAEISPQIILAHSAGCDYLLKSLLSDQKIDIKNIKTTSTILQKTQTSKTQSLQEISKIGNNSQNQFPNNSIYNLKLSELKEKSWQNLSEICLISSDWQIQNTFCPEIETKIKTGKLIIYNYFCPWDTTLWLSILVNRRIPDGLFGSRNKLVKNKLFVPFSFNFHTSLPNSSRFANQKISQIK